MKKLITIAQNHFSFRRKASVFLPENLISRSYAANRPGVDEVFGKDRWNRFVPCLPLKSGNAVLFELALAS